MLVWLIVTLLGGGCLAWLAAVWNTRLARWISLITVGVHLVFVAALWGHYLQAGMTGEGSPWLATYNHPWIPEFGV